MSDARRSSGGAIGRRPTDEEYARLLELRTGLRRFTRWSEEQAERAGLTPAQHQLMLAIRGHRPGTPTLGELADHLLLRQHSVSELVDRAVLSGMVKRVGDARDHRVVRVALTPRGRRRLDALAVAHLEELRRLAHRIGPLIVGLDATR